MPLLAARPWKAKEKKWSVCRPCANSTVECQPPRDISGGCFREDQAWTQFTESIVDLQWSRRRCLTKESARPIPAMILVPGAEEWGKLLWKMTKSVLNRLISSITHGNDERDSESDNLGGEANESSSTTDSGRNRWGQDWLVVWIRFIRRRWCGGVHSVLSPDGVISVGPWMHLFNLFGCRLWRRNVDGKHIRQSNRGAKLRRWCGIVPREGYDGRFTQPDNHSEHL
jgi:hypothetical protein